MGQGDASLEHRNQFDRRQPGVRVAHRWSEYPICIAPWCGCLSPGTYSTSAGTMHLRLSPVVQACRHLTSSRRGALRALDTLSNRPYLASCQRLVLAQFQSDCCRGPIYRAHEGSKAYKCEPNWRICWRSFSSASPGNGCSPPISRAFSVSSADSSIAIIRKTVENGSRPKASSP